MGLRDVYASLLVAHVVITLPYVVRTVVARSACSISPDRCGAHAGLQLPDGAAGASWCRRLRRPSLNLGHVRVSWPRWTIIRSRSSSPTPGPRPCDPDAAICRGAADPTIAAISTGLVLLAIVALVIGDRLVGLAQARGLLDMPTIWANRKPMKILVANPNTSAGVTDRLVAAGKAGSPARAPSFCP